MENASRKVLNNDKSTKYICNLDWQFIRTGMIQDAGKKEKPEQDKWDRILKIINKHTGLKKTDTWGKNTQVKNYPGTRPITPHPYSITINTTYIDNDTL